MNTHEMLERAATHTTCWTDELGRHHRYWQSKPPAGQPCMCGETTKGEQDRYNTRRWCGGVKVSEILADLPAGATGTPFERDVLISGVRGDGDAGPNDVTWISDAVWRAQPERLTNTKAGLIVVPLSALVYGRREHVYVFAKDPKAVFTEIVTRFFVDPQPLFDKGTAFAPDAVVGDRVRLAHGVVLGKGVVIGDGVEIGPNTVLANTTIGDSVTIGANCSIGLPGFGFSKDAEGAWKRFPHLGRVMIGDHVDIGSNTCIDRGALGDTVIEAGAKIDNLVHVAHNCSIGEGALVIAGASLCGGTRVGKGAWIAPNATTREQLTIGENAVVGLGAVVIRDVEPSQTVVGNPARPLPVKP